MKVLVTGAAGNLGSATCGQLALAGIEFRATDMRRRSDLPYAITVADITNRESCYALVEGCEAVVHLANHPNDHAGTAQRIFGENCAMNVNIFQAALESGLRKIIFASTIQTIMGSRHIPQVDRPSSLAYLPIDGDIPPAPGNTYACSKVASEVLLRSMVEHRQLHSGIALRLPMIFRMEWADWMRKNANLQEWSWHRGNTDEAFTWVSAEDVGRLMVAILKADLPGYRCYLPSHTAPRVDVSVQELIQKFFPKVALKKPLEQMDRLVDISRITAETGWVPQDDFRKA